MRHCLSTLTGKPSPNPAQNLELPLVCSRVAVWSIPLLIIRCGIDLATNISSKSIQVICLNKHVWEAVRGVWPADRTQPRTINAPQTARAYLDSNLTILMMGTVMRIQFVSISADSQRLDLKYSAVRPRLS